MLVPHTFSLIHQQVCLNPDSNSHIGLFCTLLFQRYFRNTEHIDHFTAPNSCSFSNTRCDLERFGLCSHLKDVCKENKPNSRQELAQALELGISHFSSSRPSLLHSDKSMNLLRRIFQLWETWREGRIADSFPE
jgi:hypothetical protein